MASTTTSTKGARIGFVTGIALVALMVALGVATGVAGTTDQSGWQKGLHARSEALNAKYGLGSHALGTLSASPDWRQALKLRSEALNRKYGLGGLDTVSVPSSRTQPTIRLHRALGALATASP
jgi:hypothetical protein